MLEYRRAATLVDWCRNGRPSVGGHGLMARHSSLHVIEDSAGLTAPRLSEDQHTVAAIAGVEAEGVGGGALLGKRWSNSPFPINTPEGFHLAHNYRRSREKRRCKKTNF